jgi:hypothetical protein
MVEPEYAADIKPSQPIIDSRHSIITFDISTGIKWSVSIEDNAYIHLFTVSDYGNSVTYNKVVTIYRNSPEWPISTEGKSFDEYARNLVRKYVGLGKQ